MRSLRETRKKLGFTQTELAKITSTPQSYLSEIERGKNKPSLKTKERIEGAVGKIDWIETSGMNLRSSNYYTAEKYFTKLMQTYLSLTGVERSEIKNLVKKYFKK
ncbi:MAG: helix-turn-helix transcriptional regulator [Bacteroidales bacterium]|nr:helix-turn-helix transcriptional regulator [Bacteroidales bacterium]